jgi:starch synthase (maltosyl-transferring)
VKDGPRILIEAVSPEVDSGRYPVKRLVGDTLVVQADIVRDGHDVMGAAVRYRRKADVEWREAPMRLVDNDRWTGTVPLAENARYVYTVEAWADPFASWAHDLDRRVAAGQEVSSELEEGSALVRRAAARAAGADRAALDQAAAGLAAGGAADARVTLALGAPLAALMARWGERADLARYDRELEVVVDRPAAGFAAWYELFPRSQGRVEGRSGTFDDVIARLDDIRAMGFDVVYLPPIHPIGRTGRKGRDNALVAAPGDPGSPWAIGNELGGHTAIEPGLGTLADFRRLVGAARERGMEIALDFAIQCSPDHPWVREHPEWFYRRPDGIIKYAENPPKKYEDIYPLDFGTPERDALWEALRGVVEFWIGQGVRTFRVDNPHTKPLPFWRWLIETVQARHPDTIFLSEAFTRPKMMKALAKLGFTQSYTYFTWRNAKAELTEYLTELTQTGMREYFRGNLFTNTPDILTPYLQHGGRAAFKVRVALAATLSPLYGIYSGFELCEADARPGVEEYSDNEKYAVRVRDWDAPGNIKAYIARLNALRRAHPAIWSPASLAFHPADDDAVLFYGRVTPSRDDAVFVAVNLDPVRRRDTAIHLPLADLGIAADQPYRMRNLLTGEEHVWRGTRQGIWLDPAAEPAFFFSVHPEPAHG